MTNFDNSFIKAIVDQLKLRLNRSLTKSELDAFSIKRSGIAYEMIMDFISDEQKSKLEIEKYVEAVVEENYK
ncbi:hypothetical protein EO244_12985 [Ancylomarina salipaludis]|uniref:Uncharacterized protein n=1 Tax=Ancylomarina salipaludis TaxID=2501299 RepID=A0A4Q1JKJ2_9BACT|nr:hypothetical protein [Ancylomarina salipaludis]RXQ91012.1 hypothetical protein EO244_12985 [Ancylomarina salipaludis]